MLLFPQRLPLFVALSVLLSLSFTIFMILFRTGIVKELSVLQQSTWFPNFTFFNCDLNTLQFIPHRPFFACCDGFQVRFATRSRCRPTNHVNRVEYLRTYLQPRWKNQRNSFCKHVFAIIYNIKLLLSVSGKLNKIVLLDKSNEWLHQKRTEV